MKIKKNSQSAISLIEVCIAMVILVTIIATMVHSVNEGYRYLRKTRLLTIGQFLAQEAMEEKLNKSSWPPAGYTRTAVTGFSGFDRQVTVTTPALTYNNLALVQVTAYWQGQRGEQSITLKSYLANF